MTSNSNNHGVAAAWAPPGIRGRVVDCRGSLSSVQALVDRERAGWNEGFAAGRDAALLAAEAELQPQRAALQRDVATLRQLLDVIARPLTEFDNDAEQQLLQLALAVGKQLARRELSADPAQIIAILREAITALPMNARDIVIKMHPADAAVVRACLQPADGAAPQQNAWELRDDPTQERGGCVVSSEFSQIDARLDARVAELAAHLLGEERDAR